MVFISEYGHWLTRELDLGPQHSGLLAEVLPYALREILLRLRTSQYGKWESDKEPSRYFKSDVPRSSSSGYMRLDFIPLVATPFGSDAAVGEVLSQVLGVSGLTILKYLPAGIPFRDLPAVKSHLEELRKACTCGRCCESGRDLMTTYKRCLRDQIFYIIARLVQDILCISLFDSPNSLLLSLDQQLGIRDSFLSSIYLILTEDGMVLCTIGCIFRCALALIGHENVQSERPLSIISSAKGQVIYPKLFRTNVFSSRGYMALSWGPGRLHFQDKIYQQGVERISSWTNRALLFEVEPVSTPLNLFPNHQLAWQVIAREGYLEIEMTCQDKCSKESLVRVHAEIVLKNISEALILEECGHLPDTPLGTLPENYPVSLVPTAPTETFHWLPQGEKPGKPIISCVAVAEDDGLRMVALGCQAVSIVIRGRACLACAVDVCRTSTFPVLIL